MSASATAASRSAGRDGGGSRRGAVRPRRLSGPATPARAGAALGAAATSARTGAALGATATAAPGVALPQRRRSRHVVEPRRRQTRKRTHRSAHDRPGIALRAIDALRSITANSVLDGLIRGRAWIGLLAFALIGIVTMQLLVLELTTGIGRTLGRVATLQRQDAQLGIEDSMYSAESRVAPLAAAAGMTLAPAGTVHFVAASPADVARAAAALSTSLQSPVAGSSEAAAAAAGSSEAGGAAPGSAGSESGAVASSGASAQSGSGAAEATGSGETAGSSPVREGATGSSESSAASSAAGSSAAGSSPAGSSVPATSSPTPAATSAGAPWSSSGAQATGASSAPSSGSAASSGAANAPGGGTQAGARE